MDLYTKIAGGLLFPLHERLKGHDTVSICRELEHSQWFPPEQIASLQLERLRGLLTRVAQSVPFYQTLFRDRHLTAADFNSLAMLQRLPVVDKALIREHFKSWQACPPGPLSQHSTSGSSGEPLHFLLGRHRISFDIAAKWRAMRWWGVDIGDRELVLWGSTLEANAQNRLRELRDRLLRSRLVPAHDLNAARIDHILSELCAFRPKMLFGYPSALARIALRARERGLEMGGLDIRVAFCTSEVLRPEWRQLISSTFACGVADEYGARDAGFIARECPHGGLHITAEELIVEIVDDADQPLPAGTEGHILVTNLAGPEFPFIRYRTGDRGILSPHRCACGRGLPLLAAVSGRANDGLVALDGSWVHGSAVNHVMRELTGLRAYRIVQDSRDALTILLALDAPLPQQVAGRLRDHVQTLLGAGMAVSIREVDEISPEPNGKFRHIICRIEQPERRPAAAQSPA